ncbi:hypothetical protein CHS0354_015661, partial [Potamilus streckersoni]
MPVTISSKLNAVEKSAPDETVYTTSSARLNTLEAGSSNNAGVISVEERENILERTSILFKLCAEIVGIDP